MSNQNYHRLLYEAKQDLARHLVERQNLDQTIARLHTVVGDLQNLCAELDRKSFQRGVERTIKKDLKVGITDSARVILQENFFPMTAGDLKQKIEARKLQLTRYANPLAVIHTVLKRLVRSGEVKEVTQAKGKKAYQWISAADRALAELQESRSKGRSRGDRKASQ